MKLIKSVEIINVPDEYDNCYKIWHLQNHIDHMLKNCNPMDEIAKEDIKLYMKYVRGERFVNHYGEEVYIGMTKEVRETIGIPLEVSENQRKEIDKQDTIIFKLKNELVENNLKYKTLEDKIYNMNFFDRLKFLFKKWTL